MIVKNGDRSRRVISTVISVVLWAATVVLGAVCVWRGLNIVIALLLLFPPLGANQLVALSGQLSAVRWVGMFIGGIIWLIITIGGAEYHFKRIGLPQSQRLYRWTIGVEAAIIVGAWLITLLLRLN